MPPTHTVMPNASNGNAGGIYSPAVLMTLTLLLSVLTTKARLVTSSIATALGAWPTSCVRRPSPGIDDRHAARTGAETAIVDNHNAFSAAVYSGG